MKYLACILLALILCCTALAVHTEGIVQQDRTLYYNPDGGSRYHVDRYCPSTSDKYLPLAGIFNWAQLDEEPYAALVPCSVCQAPERSSGPAFTVEIIAADSTSGTGEPPYPYEAIIRGADGSILQTISYRSSADKMAYLQDVNEDGYGDLLLMTAHGAANAFFNLLMWNPETGRFCEPAQHCAFDFETHTFAQEVTPLEIAYTYVMQGMLVSYVCDGYLDRYFNSYTWEGLTPAPWLWASITSHGDNVVECIGYGTQTLLESTYPLAWYESAAIYDERTHAICQVLTNQQMGYAQVDHTNWVNLRKQDSKASQSLAKLLKGKDVRVLGEHDGWVHVLAEVDSAWQTGYIWHSFLTRLE